MAEPYDLFKRTITVEIPLRVYPEDIEKIEPTQATRNGVPIYTISCFGHPFGKVYAIVDAAQLVKLFDPTMWEEGN